MDGEVMIILKMRAVIKVGLRVDDHLQEELKRRSLVLSAGILCSTQSSVGARPANREERQHGLLIPQSQVSNFQQLEGEDIVFQVKHC